MWEAQAIATSLCQSKFPSSFSHLILPLSSGTCPFPRLWPFAGSPFPRHYGGLPSHCFKVLETLYTTKAASSSSFFAASMLTLLPCFTNFRKLSKDVCTDLAWAVPWGPLLSFERSCFSVFSKVAILVILLAAWSSGQTEHLPHPQLLSTYSSQPAHPLHYHLFVLDWQKGLPFFLFLLWQSLTQGILSHVPSLRAFQHGANVLGLDPLQSFKSLGRFKRHLVPLLCVLAGNLLVQGELPFMSVSKIPPTLDTAPGHLRRDAWGAGNCTTKKIKHHGTDVMVFSKAPFLWILSIQTL